jgi:plasmid maintenance system killer protein
MLRCVCVCVFLVGLVGANYEDLRKAALLNAGPLTDRFIYVGVPSAPENFQRRQSVRKAWLTSLSELHSDSIQVKFVIGHADFQSSNQGSLPSDSTSRLERHLACEAASYGDIERIPMVDTYRSLPDKVLHLFALGVEKQYRLIVKIDDDQLLDTKSLFEFVLNASNPEGLVYAGNELFSSPRKTTQYGADHKFTRYFSGPSYLLSWKLAWQITKNNKDDGSAYLTYGSSSEDVDMGKWVASQERIDPSLTFTQFHLSKKGFDKKMVAESEDPCKKA